MTAITYKKAPNPREIKTLYQTAFPKEELLPWWVVRLLTVQKCANLTGYYQKESLAGFTFTATAGDILFVLFFAVEEGKRGMGLGSEILNYLKETNPGKTIVLNVEPILETAQNNDQRIRRMAFYQKNGFYDTGYYIREVGGVFRVLATTPELNTNAYLQVFRRMSLGLWKPEITKVET